MPARTETELVQAALRKCVSDLEWTKSEIEWHATHLGLLEKHRIKLCERLEQVQKVDREVDQVLARRLGS